MFDLSKISPELVRTITARVDRFLSIYESKVHLEIRKEERLLRTYEATGTTARRQTKKDDI